MTSMLAIETSTPACSVALRVGDAVISRYCEEPRSHTRLVMSMIDEVLGEAGIKPNQLDALAVTLGPGSFTGLRIGFATVQGLAFGLDLPVVALSTLRGNGTNRGTQAGARKGRDNYAYSRCAHGRV